MMEVQKFMAKRGLSMAECEKESLLGDADFNTGMSSPQLFVCGRDEFGLPKFTNHSSGGSGVKDKEAASIKMKKAEPQLDTGFPPLPRVISASPTEEVVLKNSWAKVVRDPPPPVNNVSFNYCPLPAGTMVVSPPIEVLRESWENRCLLNVFQKDNHVFIFKLHCSQPMLLKAWGQHSSAKVAEKMPLWVKFSKIPDCYWTSEGLSWLGSVIGKPLCVDALTSKLEILPFAKMCVEYKIGDALPEKIEVETLDSVSGEISITEVLVHYPVKPLICSGCHSLGHPVSACPTTKRIWVEKRKQQEQQEQQEGHRENKLNPEVPGVEQVPVATHNNVEEVQTPVNTTVRETLVNQKVVTDCSILEESPSPVLGFKNLMKADEIDGGGDWPENYGASLHVVGL
ncbi:hypothetical protein POM88_041216 [Heracleum sosnowskyi]|uniref:DUF4283 domain-containing protein n=1 Tax=Heracleum sosnowskyi TaxID=360622 RepID=A0AAD8M851_9APIA|nr:hypothetical protein POM88_041216 [Heracleum sosnowskyi]